MEFNQIHSYKILDDGQIKNANILFTMYFDSDNKIRKVFKRWADGGALHRWWTTGKLRDYPRRASPSHHQCAAQL